MSKRVTTLETTIRLYHFMHDRLKYLQPSITSLIAQAASAQEFSSLGFLSCCSQKMSEGESFSKAWTETVNSDIGVIGKESIDIMVALSEVLGRSELENQLAALEYGINMLESRLEEARSYATKHKKLYQTLGVLSGLAIAILIA